MMNKLERRSSGGAQDLQAGRYDKLVKKPVVSVCKKVSAVAVGLIAAVIGSIATYLVASNRLEPCKAHYLSEGVDGSDICDSVFMKITIIGILASLMLGYKMSKSTNAYQSGDAL